MSPADMSPIDRLIDETARALARLAYIAEFGRVRAARWPEDVATYVERNKTLFERDAWEILPAILPHVVAARAAAADALYVVPASSADVGRLMSLLCAA